MTNHHHEEEHDLESVLSKFDDDLKGRFGQRRRRVRTRSRVHDGLLPLEMTPELRSTSFRDGKKIPLNRFKLNKQPNSVTFRCPLKRLPGVSTRQYSLV